MTFTNTTGTDITVSAYTVIFYNSGGAETGSQTGVNVPLTVTGNNSVTDPEDHEYVAPVPPDSSTLPAILLVPQAAPFRHEGSVFACLSQWPFRSYVIWWLFAPSVFFHWRLGATNVPTPCVTISMPFSRTIRVAARIDSREYPNSSIMACSVGARDPAG